MFILFVTWFAFSQPPVSTQTVFHSGQTCNAARMAIIADQAHMKAAQDQQDAIRMQRPGVVAYNPIPVPTVSAVCAPA